jgi:gluconolactonase
VRANARLLRCLYAAITVVEFAFVPAQAAEPDQKSYPALGNIERLDPALDALISREAKIEILASGFTWAEGPVWVHDGKYLLFSDIPRNSVFKWKESEGITLYLKPSGYTGAVFYGPEPGSNGLLLDRRGRLVSMEHGDRRVSVLLKDGGKRTLVDNYRGKRLNSPNDGAFRSTGDLYFTDPPYGLPNRLDDHRKELDFQGVYCLTRDGELRLLTNEIKFPNGLAFSPDEKILYIAQSDPDNAVWFAFDLQEDGNLANKRVFFDATNLVGKVKGLPDGLKVDKHGNLFATGPGGVLVFSPDGKHLGTLATGVATANCGWGDNGATLFITADRHLCRIRLTTTATDYWHRQAIAAQSISERLMKKISVDFKNEFLSSAVAVVSRETDVRITIDGPGMKMVGVTQNERQQFKFENVPATVVLARMLNRKMLVLVVDDENDRAIITSRAAPAAQGLKLLPLEDEKEKRFDAATGE